jgi:hypothetical protein
MFSIIAIGIAAIAAVKTYDRAAKADPEGTHTKVESWFQGAELLRTIAAFVTSLFYVLRGHFRPVGQVQPRQGGLAFGSRLASDAD